MRLPFFIFPLSLSLSLSLFLFFSTSPWLSLSPSLLLLLFSLFTNHLFSISQYLKDALDILAGCRSVLKYSYAFIFYATRNAQVCEEFEI